MAGSSIIRTAPRERTVLVAAQFRAATPISVLKKGTGLRDHTIRYYLHRFREEGVIRPTTFFDPYALGFTQYELFFSLAPTKEETAQRLLAYFEKHERVAYYAELGGSFQYAVTVCVRTVGEMVAFLNELSLKFGSVFFSKAISVIESFSVFRKKYLAPAKAPNDWLSFGSTSPAVTLDALDRSLLMDVVERGLTSHAEISERMNVPRTTVAFRLKRMEESGVIRAYIYLINARRLGILTYKLLLFGRGLERGLYDKLFEFGRAHPSVVNVAHCVGSWDYELTVEVENAREITAVTQDLSARFGASLSQIQTLPVFFQAQSKQLLRGLLDPRGALSKR